MWNRLKTLCVEPLKCINWAFAWALIRVSVTLLKYRLIKASILTSSSAGLCAVLTLTHQLPVQRTTDTLQALLMAQRVKHCDNCTLDKTPVVGDMCQWGWSCEGVPELWVTWGTPSSAVHTFTRQIHQLPGKGTMTSCSYVIIVIKNLSPWSFRVTVFVCLGQTPRSLPGSKGDRHREVTCARLHFPVYPTGTIVVLFVYQTPLSPSLLFLSCFPQCRTMIFW